MPKRALSSLFATAVAAAALTTSAGALAQTRTTDEQNAVIQSYVDTEEGCLIVDLVITSVKQAPPGGQVGFSSLVIYRDAIQDCATHLAAGGGFLVGIASGNTNQNPMEFTLDQRLRSGTLKMTMSVLFWATSNEHPVVIDLVFSGIEGTLTPERRLDTFPGNATGPVIVHNRGYRRDTTASGSVSDGATEYFANPYAVKGFLRVYHTQASGPGPRMLH
jgi:hypothetical protein